MEYNQLDIMLNEYYASYDRDDWYDHDGVSALMRHVKKTTLRKELRFDSHPMDCELTLIPNFPLPKNVKIMNEYHRRALIFYIIQWCWSGVTGEIPDENSMSILFICEFDKRKITLINNNTKGIAKFAVKASKFGYPFKC